MKILLLFCHLAVRNSDAGVVNTVWIAIDGQFRTAIGDARGDSMQAVFDRRVARPRLSAALKALALLGAGVAAVSVSAPAVAQDYNQVQATGRVQGTNGQPIAGATVTVTSNDQGFVRTVTTGSDGTFRVQALPQGNYTFNVAADGFDTFTDPNVSLTQGNSANQFTLSPTGGADAGDIVVRAGRVRVVDFDRTTTGAVINVSDLATRVPVARDLTSVVLLAPGTTGGDTAFGNLPSVNGASVSENAYYINGLNVTQFRNGLGAAAIPFEFYQTVETKTGGISAEFGRITGGFVNATTKSGSNEFHGGITFNWEPNGLRSKSPNTYASDNDAAFNERKEFIAQLSGPIIKDHLFFYGIYNARDVQSNFGSTATISATGTGVNGCVTNPGYCADFGNLSAANLKIAGTSYNFDRNTTPFYAGKIDAVIVDGQRIEATYFRTAGETVRQIFGTSGLTDGFTRTFANGGRYNLNTNQIGRYATTTRFRSGGENYVFRYTGTFTNWLTLSGAYGVNKNTDTTESAFPNLPSIVDQRNGGNSQIGNVTANNSVNFDKRTFYRADVDLNFNFVGSHHIRGGYDREELNLNQQTLSNGPGQVTLLTSTGLNQTGLPAGTSYVKVRRFRTGGEFNSINQAFYVQDSWSLFSNRLLLNLGVRNDSFNSKNGSNVTFFRQKNLWSPRLGFSLDPQGEGRSRVYGSFSRYYLPVAVNTNVRLAGVQQDYDAFYQFSGLNSDNTPILTTPLTTVPGNVACPGGTPAGTSCLIRQPGDAAQPTGSTVSSNLKAQSTEEYILGGEQRIGSRIKIGAYFTLTKLRNSLEDAELDQAIVPYCVSQGKALAACQATFSGSTQGALINPGSDVVVDLAKPLPGETAVRRQVLLSAAALNYPRAERHYRAMSFTFDREFDGKWDFHLNYTYSKLYGNIEGGVRSDNGQTDSGLTTAFDFPALVTGTYGYLPNDRRHALKAFGSYRIADWLTLGANGSMTSPRHFGCFGTAPASADFNATQVSGIAGPLYNPGAAAYCNVSNGQIVTNPVGFQVINDPFNQPDGVKPSTLQVVRRGTAFQSDWVYLLNLDATVQIPTDAFNGFVRFSVFNVFNWQAKSDFNEIGTLTGGVPSATYRLPQVYQTPRYVRVQLGVSF